MHDARRPTKRLFIGLELPDDIRHALSRVDHGVSGVRWVREDLLHLTMAFLDEVDEERDAALRRALLDVHVEPFDLRVRGLGVFGGARPRIVWAGLGEVHPHLRVLDGQIRAAVHRAGLAADPVPFHPHVTLGRMRDVKRAALQPFLDRHAETAFGAWTVTGVTLFRSVLSSKGPEYTAEMRRVF